MKARDVDREFDANFRMASGAISPDGRPPRAAVHGSGASYKT